MGAPYGVCGRLGSVAATYALEHLGGTSHAYTWKEFTAALRAAFRKAAGVTTDDSSDSFHDREPRWPWRSLSVTAVQGQAPTKTTNERRLHGRTGRARQEAVRSEVHGCHDTARFTGETFLDPWDGKPLKDVWDIASGTMPEDNPGSLQQQEYGDILAYFLHLNAFPTGETELQGNAAAMAAIKIEKKK